MKHETAEPTGSVVKDSSPSGGLPSSSLPARIMGVLNVTPDSFSDGGRFWDADAAIAHARRLVDEGADIIDVGGESTRPGSEPVSAEEQIRRTVPVIRRVREFWDGPVSIDTTRAAVAVAACAGGADWINDISALRDDPEMVRVVADTGSCVVLMHMQGKPGTMQEQPTYADVVTEVADFLRERAAFAMAHGVPADRIVGDPGIGFGKSIAHNLELLRGLPRLTGLGMPLCVGLSRKSFIGRITGADVDGRLEGSIVGAVCAVQAGAAIVRVHDVQATRRALLVAQAMGAFASRPS
ncbi:MAG TPA: dihydropteroate synthase [Acidobacteriota bacterium]|nr:dihydropteroate synthase [Acidobacteriota bacterium]